MPLVRPISALGPTVTSMGGAAEKAAIETVKKATLGLRTVVARNGGRHHIKGRNGKPVPLGASSNVMLIGSTPVGQVKGVPEGFWAIVEHGSGAHIIRPRKGSRKAAGRSAVSYGPQHAYALVHHPGHGPQGKPWAESMLEGRAVVSEILAVESTVHFFRAFT